MQLPIKRAVERVPGGMMIVPLALGCLLTFCAPSFAAKFAGTFTAALMSGTSTILAVFYLCLGSTISFRSTPQVLGKGGALLATKIICGVTVGLIAAHFLREKPLQSGFFSGISALALVAAFNDTNGGLYMALMSKYGSPRDVAAYSVMSIESGPFLTMVSLGVVGLSAFNGWTLLGTILPLICGMILGNLDHELRDLLGKAVPALVPFFAFAIGVSIKLTDVIKSGSLGILLGVSVVVISGILLYTVDRLTGGSGVAGVAAASTAGNAATVPLVVAQTNPAYISAQPSATLLVSASVCVTAFLVPILTAWVAHKANKRAKKLGETES